MIKKSFEDLNNWYNILSDHSYDNIIFLIGNKIDLEEKRKVIIEDTDTFKNKYDDIKIFLEISYKNGENIDKLLDNIEILIYEKDINGKNNSGNAIKGGRIALNKEDFTNKGKRKKK